MEAVKEVPLANKFDIIDFLLNNQIYIYLIVILIILVIIGWYLYNKYFNKKNEESLDIKKSNKDHISNEKEDNEHIMNPKKKYYIIDQNNNPILLNPYLPNILNHHNSIQQNQLNKQSEQKEEKKEEQKQEKEVSKQRPKLSHPRDKENITLNDLEDENLAALNLTNDEMIELKKQLLQLQKTQKNQITAQNDEDDDDSE